MNPKQRAVLASFCAAILAGCGGSTDPAESGATWEWLSISQGWGPCPTGEICSSSWHVVPSGVVTTSKKGVAGTATMSSTDLSALDAILRSPGFQQSMQNGFKCQSQPTDVSASFQFMAQGKEHSQFVTGCVFNSSESNDAHKVSMLVTPY